jgi:hypothetical protein
MSTLAPTTRDWLLYPYSEPDRPVTLIDALCHWQQNLFMVGPGVARYIRPPLTFWGKLKLDDGPTVPMLAQLHMQTETGNGLFLPICVRLSDSGQVVFVDSITLGVLKQSIVDFAWPPPDLPGPALALRVTKKEREELLSIEELGRMMGGASQERMRFDGEGGIIGGA